MKKSNRFNNFAVCLAIVITLVSFSGQSHADWYTYDDFTNSGINWSLWEDRGPNYGLFSQPGDGNLYFNDPSGYQSERLRSYNPISGGFFAVAMQYSNFQSNNEQPPGYGLASVALLRLGYDDDWVDILEYKIAGGFGFQAISVTDWGTINQTRTSLNVVPTDVHSGWLGIAYDGISELELWYNPTSEWTSGWTQLASCTQNFSQAPFFSIRGWNTYDGEPMSFQVNQVLVYSSVPLPGAVWLLGSGLLGLVGLRRFSKN